MNVLGFGSVGFLWTLIVPLIVLIYYFFRKKYKQQTVSSTIFWEEAMQETKVSPYLKKLQKNALLFLQLAALLLLVFALMKPFIAKTTIAGSQVIWIVDTSATMLAGKGDSLFAEHVEEMKRLTKELDTKPLTLITTGNSPQTVLRQETDSSRILQALENLSVSYEEEHMANAIHTAQAFIGDEATSVYVFTDAIERNMLPVENSLVEWHVVGAEEEMNNVAITKLAATANEQQVTALVQLRNDTAKKETVELTLMNESNEPVKTEKVTMEPHEQVSKLYEDIPSTPTVFATIDAADDYSPDNEAVVLLGENDMEVLLDPDMHQLVQKGFVSVYDEVTYFDETTLKNGSDQSLLVTNDVSLMDDANMPVFLIGRDDVEGKGVSAAAANAKHPLFSFSSLEDVYISKLYPPFEGFETIATVGDEPLIQLSPKGDLIVLTDLEATDWPLHPSFPLFLWSAVQELGSIGQPLGTFTPLEERAIPLVENDWAIYKADGEYVSSFESGKQFRAPSEPGQYQIVAGDETKQFVVQLAQGERNIEKGASFTIGQIENEGKEAQGEHSIVPYFLLVILILIVTEWEVQRRRGFTN
ncbi:MAG: BatA and WFA domain-containing protein [Lysinibacillus sp.]